MATAIVIMTEGADRYLFCYNENLTPEQIEEKICEELSEEECDYICEQEVVYSK